MIRVPKPPESYLSRTQRGIQQQRDKNTTPDQDFVALAPCRMPIEVVSVRLREHPYGESTPASIMSWTERRDMQLAQ